MYLELIDITSTNCNKSVMGDEIHFLYECTKLNNLRVNTCFLQILEGNRMYSIL